MDPTRSNPPVAVRVIRPFADEGELLAAEANTFTRTGVVLVGGPSRPNGVVLRFELCLRDGTVVMRGEGRVVGYRGPSADGADEEGALMLRFTRLDVKSKELLDRAVALREERRSMAPPSRSPPAAQRPLTQPPPPPPLPTHAEEAVMDVNEVDLRSADDNDRTAQAPPVALVEAAAQAEAAAPGPKEKLPLPTPSPASVPAPKQAPPPSPATPVRSPEPAPHPRAPEQMPTPQRSPEPKRRASDLLARARGERESDFRPTLEPPQRESALDRLRERKRTSQS